MKKLERKYKKYLQLLPKQQDKYGFIDFEHCDSLLFSGLIGSLPEVKVNIEAAYDKKTGLWLRRPIDCPCFDCIDNIDLGAKSSISRDMLLGLAYFCFYNNRKDIAEQVVKYALSHWLIMGKAIDKKNLLSRCLITPGLLATFALISGKYKWLHWVPAEPPFSPTQKGYKAHLQVLHRLLRHKIKGTNPRRDKILREQATKQPQNPLFLAALGQYSLAEKKLLDERLWPSERLPTSHDRKAQWLPMRALGPDWKPDLVHQEKEFSGGDFLFVAAFILGRI